MSYTEMVQVAQNKAARATIEECNYAIKDIDATLKLHPMYTPNENPYVQKLFAERDAYIERKMKLQYPKKRRKSA